ncbi:MAG TPA: winged helix-turn-helix domain-containing protein [Pyrinomonadaceae bacterium]|nr:winged helix-turn-helix domain-containing protein [Pyrinomonadaceae bacterium]
MDNNSEYKTYSFDDFSLDAEKLMLYRGGREISLPPKAIRTLVVLVESQGEILSKDELIDAVWQDSVVEESNLSQYLYLLRKQLGSHSDGTPYIETLRRRGYRFTGKATLHGKFADRSEKFLGQTPPRHSADGNGKVVTLADWKAADYPVTPAPTMPRQGEKVSSSQFGTVLIPIALILIGVLSAGLAWNLFPSDSTNPVQVHGEMTVLRLTNGGDVMDATIAPDGKYFVYHERDDTVSRMWLQQTGHATRVEIIPASSQNLSGKTFSPDGQFVYFMSAATSNEPYSLYRVPTLGGPIAKILSNVDSYVSFSPDGGKFAFLRWDRATGEASYAIKASDGSGEEKTLYNWVSKIPLFGNPAWSPDGKLIAFSLTMTSSSDPIAPCSIVTIDVESAQMKPVSEEKWDTCYRMAWRADGGGLYMIGTKENEGYSTRRDQVYFISFPEGRSRRITADGNRHHPSSLGVTNDNKLLALPFNRSSQIWSMDPNGESRTAVQITSGHADGRAGLATLADGRIAYVTRTGDNLSVWRMNQDGSDQTPITVEPPVVEELRSGGDGRYLVFSAPQGRNSHIFRVNSDGTSLKQLTFGEASEIDSSLSNDGKWIVYDSYRRLPERSEVSLWKLSIEGGDPVRLSKDDCAAPHFSPDDKLISCVVGEKEIRLLSAVEGSLINSIVPHPQATLNFGARWSPDGRSLVYIVSEKGGISNLWLHPVDGKRPRRLTEFSTGSIYNFVYSRDGARLFAARGHQMRDAVLITPPAN